jgi:uncharacterized protein YjdB
MIKNVKHLFLLTVFLCSGMLHAQTTDLLYNLGSSGSTVELASVATDPGGNIFVCGSFTGTNVEFDPLGPTPTLRTAPTSGSGFIASYDVNGILKKVITFGETLVNKGLKVVVDPVTKNVYLLATASGTVKFFTGIGFGVPAGTEGMVLVKFDNALTHKSTKIFKNTTSNAGDIINDLVLYGPDLYITGTLFNDDVEFNPGGGTSKTFSSIGVSEDIFVAKYDTTTLINQWVYAFGGSGADGGKAIDIDNSGNIYLTGYFSGLNVDLDPTAATRNLSDVTGGASTDAFVVKYNSSMVSQWAFNIGAGLTDKGNDIIIDETAGNIYVGGFVKDDILVVDFNPSTTSTANFAGIGANDVFVASYTLAGAYNWHLATGSIGEDDLTSLTFDSGGNIILSGWTNGSVNFGNSKTITGLGNKDAFFAIISAASGLTTAAYNLGGTNDEQANSVVVAPDGKVLVVGSYKGAGDYNLGAAATLPITGIQDGFISRHTLCIPPVITGTVSACIGSTTQLTGSGSPAASGAWVSASPSVATVSNGLVTGISSGTSIITYTNSAGCSQTAVVTVNPKPSITGTVSACIGSTTQLTGSGSPAASGAWVSASPSVATISNAGLVTGVAAGTSSITYTNAAGCTIASTVTITASPTITGTASACIGSTTQLTGSGIPAASNAWVSTSTSVATISNAGLVTGVAAGTSSITYTNAAGCTTTSTVTITASPTITGTASACIGSTTQLSGSGSPAASNAWVSASPSVATISNAGLVTGVAAGTSSITYTNAAGCTTTSTVTITASPTITGTASACIGSTTQLSGSGSPAASNAWVSASPSVATISNAGLVTGVAAGTSSITYTNAAGCTIASTVTITASPTITGTASACIGSTTQLTGSGSPAASNAWVSASPSVATISNAGLVTGVAAGTSSITYTNAAGCTIASTVTITASPTITGTASACIGSTTQLTGSGSPAAINAWVSASPSVATISNTGLVTGVAAGTSSITYTNAAGCSIASTVTITASPTITGTASACIGSTTQLTGSGSPAASNAWVSASPSVATISNTGLVTGVAAGTSSITYTNAAGCSIASTVTITASPTITGTASACIGSTTQLTGSGSPAASNAWVSASPSVATISNAGLVTGVAAGTAVITYRNSNGCIETEMVTIYALPVVSGDLSVCVASTTQLSGSGSPAASNAWVSASPSVATVSNAGLVTGVSAGTAVITYTNSNGCSKTAVVSVTSTVTPQVSISSNTSTTICSGSSITLTANPTNGGTPTYKWKLGTNYITGETNATYTTTGAANNNSYSVEMTSSSGCASPAVVTSNPVVITVNPTPTPTVTISTASSAICAGGVITFSSSVTNEGGAPSYVWRKNGTPIVPAATGTTYSTTGAANGDVYSVALTSSALCASPSTVISNTVPVTVNSLPVITGGTTVCAGSTITLTGTGTAHTTSPWVSASLAVATVSNTGLVTGIAAGTSVITYTNNNGCSQTSTVTVNAAATITGISSVCTGATTQLTGSNVPAGSNAWASASTSRATITNTGLVTGVSAGTSTITYTDNAGCSKTTTVTVNALPDITGIATVCAGLTTQLTGSASPAASNAWISGSATIATVNNSGLVTGVSAGTSSITYKNSNGCTASQTVTVNAATAPGVSITANNSTICAGSSITFTSTAVDGGTAPTYKWKLGANYISGGTGANYTTTAAQNGESYSVEMTSNALCASTSIVTSNPIVITVTTSAAPTVTISTNPANSICSGTPVIFTAIPGIGGTAPAYQWKKGGVNISGATNATYTSSTLANGDQISVDMVSNSACASTPNASSLPITMSVNSIVTPIVTIATPSTAICSGVSATFTASYTNEGFAPLFEWFVNNVSQGAAGSGHTYTSSTLANNDQIRVRMTSDLTCVTNTTVPSNSITVAVTEKVVPVVTIVSDKNTICAGGTVIYTATSLNGGTASYQWKVNGTNSGASTTANVFNTSGLSDGDVVTVVLSSSVACVTSSTATSNELSIIVAPETQITSQPSDQSVCTLGNNVTFSVGATGNNLTYQWKAGNTNLANNSTYSGVTTKDLSISNVSNADLLGYKVTVTGTCGTLTSSVATLTQSASSINITAQPITQVVETGEMIQLSVSATGPTLSYQWKKNGVDLVNDSRISGANTSSLQISNALVSDSDNNYTCLIMSPCAAQVTTTATSVTVTTATSTQDALTKGFIVAPNPSAGHFTLSNNYSPFMVEEIQIISMDGMVVAKKEIAGTTNLSEEIFAQDLPKGMYLLVIKGEGEQALLKIVFDK